MELLNASSWVDNLRMLRVDEEWGFLVTTTCMVLGVSWVVSMLYRRLWQPYSRRRFYEKQGIRGPAFRPFIGNLPELRKLRAEVPKFGGHILESPARRVATELFVFSEKYGKVSIFEQGSLTRIILADAKLAKEVLVTKAKYYHKGDLLKQLITDVVGGGSIITAEGASWKQKNQIMSPTFRHTVLKDLFHHILESGNKLVTKWQTSINNAQRESNQGIIEVAIDHDVPKTLLDIIVGSMAIEDDDVYAIHDTMRSMIPIVAQRLSGYGHLFPGYSFIPTPTRIKSWMERWTMEKAFKNILNAHVKLEKELKGSNIDAKAIRERIYGSDLLGMMLEIMYAQNSNMTMSQVLDECKTMCLATDNPCALLLMWTLTLLAIHPDWQQRARSEVQHVFGEAPPQPENLSHLKLIDMILNETMRLYPPVVSISRDALQAHQIGLLNIVANTNLIIPISVLHQSEELWGHDAQMFKPERWEVLMTTNDANGNYNGHNNAIINFNTFMPFGGGNRICLGRNLARMTTKLLLSMMLLRFNFSISPSYHHSPGVGDVNLWPKFGVQLFIKNVESNIKN